MAKKTFSQKEFLALTKKHPRRAHEVYSRGVNLRLSPELAKTIRELYGKAVDDDGNVSAEAMTGVEVIAVASLVLAAFGAGVAVGQLGGGGTTVFVAESGDGDVNVNCDDDGDGEGKGGNGGNGGTSGGGSGGDTGS
jgi:hypothetical protein